MKIGVIIFLSLFFISIPLYFSYISYINNKHYEEGKKIISKFREVKKKDETFNSIKKYYINLDRSTGRKESIEEEFKLYGIGNYERVSACDGKNLISTTEGDFGDIKFKAPDDKKSTVREIATTCSHIKVIKRAYDHGDDLAIILEDDTKFTLMSYWDKELKDLINELPDDWEIFRLVSGCKEKYLKIKKFFSLNYSNKLEKQKILRREKDTTTSAVCYIINKKGMEKMKNLFYGKDETIILNYSRNQIDTDIFNNFSVYELNKDYFLLDSFEHDSTILNNNNKSVYQSLQTLKSYDI
jgi:GR25 family glycosyltransferase involved in LPS biosynthesis